MPSILSVRTLIGAWIAASIDTRPVLIVHPQRQRSH
jgi:hypothetical protein